MKKNDIDIRSDRGAGIIVLRTFSDGVKILFLRTHKGAWDIPKGRLDPGETPFQCALRETYEESGIDDLSFPWGHEPVANLEGLTIYVAKTSQDPIILPNPKSRRLEHASAHWVRAEVATKIAPKYLHHGIEAALRSVFA